MIVRSKLNKYYSIRGISNQEGRKSLEFSQALQPIYRRVNISKFFQVSKILTLNKQEGRREKRCYLRGLADFQNGRGKSMEFFQFPQSIYIYIRKDGLKFSETLTTKGEGIAHSQIYELEREVGGGEWNFQKPHHSLYKGR